MYIEKYKILLLPSKEYQVVLFASRCIHGNCIGANKGILFDYSDKSIINVFREVLKSHTYINKRKLKLLKASEKLRIKIVKKRSGSGLNSYGYSYINIGDYSSNGDYFYGNYKDADVIVDSRTEHPKQISKAEFLNIIAKEGHL